MRVLHLIDSTEPDACPSVWAWAADAMVSEPIVDHRVWLIGDAPRSVGLRVDRHFTQPHCKRPAATLQLRRALHEQTECDVVHTWSIRTAALASVLTPRYTPLMTTIVHEPIVDRAARWQRWALRRRPPQWAAGSDAARRRLMQLGVADTSAVVLEPGVDSARFADRPSRQAVRLRWGVRDEQTRIVVVLADPPSRVDALTAALAVGLADETGRSFRLLLGARAGGLRAARESMRRIDRAGRLLIDDDAETPWAVMHACDAALVMGDGLSAVWAMTSAVPVVAAPAATLGGMLVDGQTAMLSLGDSPGEMARRLIQITDDADRGRALAEAARDAAIERFDLPRSARQLRQAQQLVRDGKPIEISPYPRPPRQAIHRQWNDQATG